MKQQPNTQNQPNATKQQLHYEDAFSAVLDVMEENKEQFAAVVASLMDGEIALKHVAGISNETLDVMYGIGHKLYSGDKFQKALDVFELINLYDPIRAEAWLGAAACYKMMKNYPMAFFKYSMAVMLEPYNLEIYYHMAYCFLALNIKDKAIEALKTLLQVSKDLTTRKYDKWIEKANNLLTLLQEQAQ
jgi:type III secretion system low calcium response chaperone LcrH/SycD